MIRRAAWLGTGVALGVTGTVWGRRQAERLAARLRPTRVAQGVSNAAQATVRRSSARLNDALQTGRAEASRRETDLRRQLRLVEGERDAPALRASTGPRLVAAGGQGGDR